MSEGSLQRNKKQKTKKEKARGENGEKERENGVGIITLFYLLGASYVPPRNYGGVSFLLTPTAFFYDHLHIYTSCI